MAFHGTLDGVRVGDLLVALEHGQQTGMLRLGSGLETGLIYLVKGQVIEAIVLHRTEVAARGAMAVAVMGAWTSGGFSFSQEEAVRAALTLLVGRAPRPA